MVQIRPLTLYRPTKEKVAEVASPPYDVVNEEEAREFVAQHPGSFMRVVRPEVNLEGDSTYEAQHAEAKRQFEQLKQEGLLVADNDAGYYVYRQTQGDHQQTGLVAACAVSDYETDHIKKHEHVRPAKVVDRTQHFQTIGAQTGPIFLSCRKNAELQQKLHAACEGEALYDFKDEVGVRHEVYKVAADAGFTEALGEVPALYIADGHHRTASACAVRDAHKQAGTLTDSSKSHFFLAVIFPEDELKILAYNRLVKDLQGQSVSEVIAKIGEITSIEKTESVPPTEKGKVAVSFGEDWYQIDLTSLVNDSDSAEKQLDAYILQQHILGPVFGIDDPRTNPRIYFWGGHRGPEEMIGQITKKKAAAVFSMYRVEMSDLMDVADAGEVMPPKSTWFVPKLRSGLFVYDY